MVSEPLDVQATVHLFLREYAQETCAHRRGHSRPAQQRPGKQLDSHQFVMREPRQTFGSRERHPQRARARQGLRATRKLESFASRGPIDRDPGTGPGVFERAAAGRARGFELDREITGLEDSEAECAYGQRVSARGVGGRVRHRDSIIGNGPSPSAPSP